MLRLRTPREKNWTPASPRGVPDCDAERAKIGIGGVPEQLTTGIIEIQSTADYPLYLPAGWEVAKEQDCHFVPHGPPRLVPCQQRAAANVVCASGAGQSLAPPRGEALGSTAADTTPGPGGVGKQCLDRRPQPHKPVTGHAPERKQLLGSPRIPTLN